MHVFPHSSFLLFLFVVENMGFVSIFHIESQISKVSGQLACKLPVSFEVQCLAIRQLKYRSRRGGLYAYSVSRLSAATFTMGISYRSCVVEAISWSPATQQYHRDCRDVYNTQGRALSLQYETVLLGVQPAICQLMHVTTGLPDHTRTACVRWNTLYPIYSLLKDCKQFLQIASMWCKIDSATLIILCCSLAAALLRK